MNSIVPKEGRTAGQMAVLFAAFFWSTSGLFIKLLSWHPIVISGTRSFIAAVFLLIVRLVSPPRKGGKNPPFPFLACAVAFVFTTFTYVTAVKLTTVANVILLQYSAPVWAALLGWWLAKEKPNWEHWLALVFVTGGLLLFFRGGLDSGAFMGNTLAIISGVLMGGHTVFLRMLKDGDPRDAMLLAHAITAFLSIPFICLYPPDLNVPSVAAILYMGTVQMGVASLLISYGIKRIPAIQAVLTAIIDPMLSPVWVMVITGEKPSLSALAGGAIIIAAVVFSSLVGRRREEQIANIKP
jgi:drug/metabolite transporter (DMT)-like permease